MATTARKMVDLGLLRIFVAVAEQASFTKAAKTLAISKGTVSRAIARLEEIVGAELLHRDTHNVSMSSPGVALFERSAHHLAALTNAAHDLADRRDAPSGRLRITSSCDFGLTLLPAIVASFSLRFPEVTFEIEITDGVSNLVADGFDLSIRAAARGLSDSSLIARKIGPAELCFYGSPRYLARRGEPRDYYVPTHDWVVFRPSMRLFKLPNSAAVRYFSDDLIFVRGLIIAEAAIGTLPPFVAAEDVQAGRLVQVIPNRTLRAPGGFYVVYPTRGRTSPKVSAFRDFLVSSLKRTPLA